MLGIPRICSISWNSYKTFVRANHLVIDNEHTLLLSSNIPGFVLSIKTTKTAINNTPPNHGLYEHIFEHIRTSVSLKCASKNTTEATRRWSRTRYGNRYGVCMLTLAFVALYWLRCRLGSAPRLADGSGIEQNTGSLLAVRYSGYRSD